MSNMQLKSHQIYTNVDFRSHDINADAPKDGTEKLRKRVVSATFEHCDFSLTTIADVIFDRCVFKDCNFRGTDLYRVDFAHCTYSKTDFTGASYLH